MNIINICLIGPRETSIDASLFIRYLKDKYPKSYKGKTRVHNNEQPHIFEFKYNNIKFELRFIGGYFDMIHNNIYYDYYILFTRRLDNKNFENTRINVPHTIIHNIDGDGISQFSNTREDGSIVSDVFININEMHKDSDDMIKIINNIIDAELRYSMQ